MGVRESQDGGDCGVTCPAIAHAWPLHVAPVSVLPPMPVCRPSLSLPLSRWVGGLNLRHGDARRQHAVESQARAQSAVSNKGRFIRTCEGLKATRAGMLDTCEGLQATRGDACRVRRPKGNTRQGFRVGPHVRRPKATRTGVLATCEGLKATRVKALRGPPVQRPDGYTCGRPAPCKGRTGYTCQACPNQRCHARHWKIWR